MTRQPLSIAAYGATWAPLQGSLDRAVPGQILIGDFRRADPNGAEAYALDTLQFIEEVQPRTSMFSGLWLSGQRV